MPCIILFVGDPEFLELELTSNLANITELDLRHLRAKIGLEFLERDLVRKTDRGWTVRFHGPKKKRYQNGIQPAFVVFVPNAELAAQATPWQLLKVRWRESLSKRPLTRRGGAGFPPVMGSVLPLLSEIGAGTPAAGRLEARSNVRRQDAHSTSPP